MVSQARACSDEGDAGSSKTTRQNQDPGALTECGAIGRRSGLALLAAAFLVVGSGGSMAQTYRLGRAPTPAEIAGWNIDIGRDGRNLPPGQGDVAHGREVFAAQCAACHGDHGQGGVGDPLTGGQGTLASANPIKTVGSFWPYATTLFDYIRRAMPMNAPESLSNEDVYALCAYILHMNGIVPEHAMLDATSLPEIRMPNRDGFVSDPRPDVPVRRQDK